MLVVNGILASAMLCACGLFRPETPHIVIIATLLVERLLPLAAVHELERDQLCRGRSEADGPCDAASPAMMQQLSLSLGVAIGGYLLQIVGLLNGRPATDVHNFYVAFLGRRA